jgi:hypothetical protein
VTAMPIDLKSAKGSLEIAFAGVQFPGDTNLLRPDSQDDSDIKDFMGKGWHSWKDVPPEMVEYNHCSLPFFSPAALVFFLPAYMSAGLEDLSGNTATFTVYRLRPSEDQEHFLKWTALLTPAQKNSIALFLQYASSHSLDGASTALESYWKEFL